MAEETEDRVLLRCGSVDCRQPVDRIDGVVEARGGRAYWAAPCGHRQSTKTAETAYAEGVVPVYFQDITGIALMAAERRRQPAEEGASEEHDAQHTGAELAWAAWCYLDRATAEGDAQAFDPAPPSMWPWEPEAWKPGPTRIRELVKAGALIAAEVDRRLKAGEQP